MIRPEARILTASRDVMRWLAPGLHRRLSHYRNVVMLERIECRLHAMKDGRVMSGPFSGMRYVDQSRGSALAPKLIGSYEEELHPVLAHVLARAYGQVVDIGCAEGYYAVGLALRLPGARVIGFDTDAQARVLCGQMARLNGVEDRVTVLGACSPDGLAQVLAPRSLVICDCEGYESVLLAPAAVPVLTECDLLVETHDYLSPNVSAVLADRFRATHRINWIKTRPRDPSRYPELRGLSARMQRLAVHEFRPASQRWAWMKRIVGDEVTERLHTRENDMTGAVS